MSRRIPIWPFRRIVQLLVIALMFAFPVVARYAHVLSARQLDKTLERWEGKPHGEVLSMTDDLLRAGIPDGEGGMPERRPRKAILERTREYHGSPWSARIAGVSMTDLLAGAESIFASRTVQAVLLTSLILPLLLTLLLGRVYCGWICPMGFLFDMAGKTRSFLQKVMEIRPLNVKLSPANKYVLLGTGLVFALVTGLPALHYVYPPALLARESHAVVMALFDRAEGGMFELALVGLSGASLFLLGLWLLEVLVAPRFFCSTICPGGALYSLLGRLRLLRVRRKADLCSPCGKCDQRCPRALLPMTDLTGAECDNCGVCIDVCPSRALGYKLSFTSSACVDEPKDDGGESSSKPASGKTRAAITAVAALAVIAGAAKVAHAHHILGVPHYAYDESYPQAPVLKLLEFVGSWEVQMTGYPGNPVPGERSQLHAYMVHKERRALYGRPVTLSVHRQEMLGGRTLVHGPSTTDLNENVYKWFLSYPDEGNYEVTLAFADGNATSTLRFPLVVGDPGSPWVTLAWFAGFGGFFLLSVRAVRIKRARRAGQSAARAT
ncbi:MAG: 4Fe-4S binding protein [Planctomycetota bacterium]